jgi:hypothetical protein
VELNRILTELKENLAKLKSDNGVNEEALLNTERLKKEYRELFNILNDKNNLKQVTKKINKRNARRQRSRRSRLFWSQQKLVREKEIEQKHAEINEKLAKMQEKIKADTEVDFSEKSFLQWTYLILTVSPPV